PSMMMRTVVSPLPGCAPCAHAVASPTTARIATSNRRKALLPMLENPIKSRARMTHRFVTGKKPAVSRILETVLVLVLLLLFRAEKSDERENRRERKSEAHGLGDFKNRSRVSRALTRASSRR